MPADPSGCSIGAQVVDMSLGSEARPTRLNTDSDVDLVGRCSTGSPSATGRCSWRPPATAARSSAASSRRLGPPHRHCRSPPQPRTGMSTTTTRNRATRVRAGAIRPRRPAPATTAAAAPGDQPPSISSFSSRGPSGDIWLRPDVSAPGYNIVSAQAATGLDPGSERPEPRDAHRPAVHDRDRDIDGRPGDERRGRPAARRLSAAVCRLARLASGGSGVNGLRAPAATLVRAALMNTAPRGPVRNHAGSSPSTSRLTSIVRRPRPIRRACARSRLRSPTSSPRPSVRSPSRRFATAPPTRSSVRSPRGRARSGRAPRWPPCVTGSSVYSVASGSGVTAGTGHRDFQGTWQIGAVAGGRRAEPEVRCPCRPGRAEDDGQLRLRRRQPVGRLARRSRHRAPGPGGSSFPVRPASSAGGDAIVTFTATIPSSAPAGTYSGVVIATTDQGETIEDPGLRQRRPP